MVIVTTHCFPANTTLGVSKCGSISYTATLSCNDYTPEFSKLVQERCYHQQRSVQTFFAQN